MKHDIVIIGIGNPLLMDDRAGIEVAEQLEALNVPADIEILSTVGFDVIDKLLGYRQAYVVDACVLGGEPGTVREVSADDILGSAFLSGSHAVTLGATIKTGYEVFEDEMPASLAIILIEAENPTEFSRQCSPKVQKAITAVVDRIRLALQESARQAGTGQVRGQSGEGAECTCP